MMAVPVDLDPVFQPGRPGVLFEGDFQGGGCLRYDITPDDQEFVFVQDVESGSTQIQIVQNWFEELKARVPPPR